MKVSTLIIAAVCAVCFPLLLCAQTPRINFTAPLFYPEGLAYNEASGRFFVSSVRTGTVGSVDMQGNYKVFYEDSSLKSGFGMKVDARNNKLWVCTGDPNYSVYKDSTTYQKRIRLIGLDLSSGKKINDIDLSGLHEGKHFANDLAQDSAGNYYITDSYSPVIYKVSPEGKAELFAQSDLFQSAGVGLNGIVVHPEGYLIVVNNGDGSLFKVDMKEPSKVSGIKINTFFPGGDGLLLDKDGNLVLIQNKGVNKIFKLSSGDNWQSAKVVAATLATDRFHQPTTGTFGRNKLYVLNSKINELKDPTQPPSKEFSIQEVRFNPIN